MNLPTFLWCSLLTAAALAAQTPPPIAAPPLDTRRPFPGWEQLKGRIVVVDFWGTWCAPCLPGLEKLRLLEKQFAGRPVTFLTVARDEPDRVRKYFSAKGLDLMTFVEDDSRTFESWGVYGLPVVGIVLADGSLLGVTPGENLSAGLLEGLLAGERHKLPPIQLEPNLEWDRDEIEWRDGVKPEFYVVIKPAFGGGGYMYKPGSNRISGDGVNLNNMIAAAWQTDSFHIDFGVKHVPEKQYRYAAVVPQGREATLLPTLRDAVQRFFAITVGWQDQEREVLVLKSSKALEPSSSEATLMFMRGKITLKRQPVAKLAETLSNFLKTIVVDETGLDSQYDFLLSYRSDSQFS
jgi:thiol-disulfide isomerase/thioredoxin